MTSPIGLSNVFQPLLPVCMPILPSCCSPMIFPMFNQGFPSSLFRAASCRIAPEEAGDLQGHITSAIGLSNGFQLPQSLDMPFESWRVMLLRTVVSVKAPKVVASNLCSGFATCHVLRVLVIDLIWKAFAPDSTVIGEREGGKRVEHVLYGGRNGWQRWMVRRVYGGAALPRARVDRERSSYTGLCGRHGECQGVGIANANTFKSSVDPSAGWKITPLIQPYKFGTRMAVVQCITTVALLVHWIADCLIPTTKNTTPRLMKLLA